MIKQIKKVVAILIVILISINVSTLISSANIVNTATNDSSYLADGSVDPYRGYKGDWFTFGVKYFDPDGSDPIISKLMLKRPNGIWVSLTMDYFAGSCKEDGAIYWCSMKLPEVGTYGYKFYFKSSDKEVITLPEDENKYFDGPIVLNKNVFENYAFLVCGGGDDNWGIACERTSNQAYSTFKNLGYNNDHIIYLSNDPDDTGVDDLSTKSNVKRHLNELSSQTTRKSKIFLFICGHGSPIGTVQVKDSIIYDYELAEWIEHLNYKTITVLIDSCYSGNFIDDLSGDNRIIITSTNREKKAYGHTQYGLYFSTPFFNALASDWSYGQAWEYADKTIVDSLDVNDPNVVELTNVQNSNIESDLISIESNEDQIPLIDDNGDKRGHGTSNVDTLPLKGDGNLALQIFPGYEHDSSKNIIKSKILEIINTFLNKIIEKLEILKL